MTDDTGRLCIINFNIQKLKQSQIADFTPETLINTLQER